MRWRRKPVSELHWDLFENKVICKYKVPTWATQEQAIYLAFSELWLRLADPNRPNGRCVVDCRTQFINRVEDHNGELTVRVGVEFFRKPSE